MTYSKEREQRRQSNVPRATRPPQRVTPEMMQERVDQARAGLITFLTERRNRLGMTALDVKQSPEQVWEREQIASMQTRASVDNM